MNYDLIVEMIYWSGFIFTTIVILIMNSKNKNFEGGDAVLALFCGLIFSWGFLIILLSQLWLYRNFTKEDHAVVNALTDGF